MQIDQAQTSHNAVSDQEPNCLLAEFFYYNIEKRKEKYHPTPFKLEMSSSSREYTDNNMSDYIICGEHYLNLRCLKHIF